MWRATARRVFCSSGPDNARGEDALVLLLQRTDQRGLDGRWKNAAGQTVPNESVMGKDAARTSTDNDDDGLSLVVLATAVLRRRRTIVTVAALGMTAGLISGFTSKRMYSSRATFIPQGNESEQLSLALANSEFGIRIRSTGAGWRLPMYVAILRSRTMLDRIARDTVIVLEESSRYVAVADLFNVKAPSEDRRIDATVAALRRAISTAENSTLGAVTVVVRTAWPSVSFDLAQKLVRGVDQFGVEARQSQAAVERPFIEGQSAKAARALREAEDRLQVFMQRNRTIQGAIELGFERDRLQRDIVLRQQVYTSLLQSNEEARIQEARATPVITVLEAPRLPYISDPRYAVQKVLLGWLDGGLIGIVIVLVAHGLERVRLARNDETHAKSFF